MNIEIVQFDPNNSEQLSSMVAWLNDPVLQPLMIPRRDEGPYKVESAEELKVIRDDLFRYIVEYSGRPIGEAVLMLDPPHLLIKNVKTAWIGMAVCEQEYWRKGVGRILMQFLEKESLRLGAERIELGVFEFNERAQNFYKNMGFREVGKIPKFTYFEGRMADDLRMEKIL